MKVCRLCGEKIKLVKYDNVCDKCYVIENWGEKSWDEKMLAFLTSQKSRCEEELAILEKHKPISIYDRSDVMTVYFKAEVVRLDKQIQELEAKIERRKTSV